MSEQRDPHISCDVCGRTLLKGERTHEYVTPHGDHHEACVLCRSRAEASGWIPAEQYRDVASPSPTRARRGEALRQRLGRAASSARAAARATGPRKRDEPPHEPEEADAPHAAEDEPAKEAPAKAEKPKRSAAQGRTRPAAEKPKRRTRPPAKRQPKRQAKQKPKDSASPEKPRARRGPQALMRRAVERFNRSDEARKVAGLYRSLGEPHAAVLADSSRQLALVTVAWELSWYQWEVSADGEGEPVREVAKGKEVSELAEDARKWNAAVAEDGKLRLRTASARRKASAKEA